MTSKAPSRGVAALLALVACPGVGHAYLGLVRRGVLWLVACLALPVVVAAFTPSLAASLGGTGAMLVLFASLALAWIGPPVDVLLLRRERFGQTRIVGLVVLLCVGIIGAVVTRVAIRVLLLEAFKIPSGAMTPTLVPGDHLFVDKLAYRAHDPRRGEVMVFAFPEHPEQDFIKRAVAIGGDRLDVEDGHPVVNGWRVPSCRLGPWSYTEADSPVSRHDGDLYVEFLGDESYLTFYDRATGAFPQHQGPYFAKPGETWVMGDNRNNSHDSRMWFGGQGGGVPRALLRGRALFIWLSVGDGGIRWERTGRSVHGADLDPSMDSLRAAFDACMKNRPSRALPPPPKP